MNSCVASSLAEIDLIASLIFVYRETVVTEQRNCLSYYLYIYRCIYIYIAFNVQTNDIKRGEI
jgi:hypothetical protein